MVVAVLSQKGHCDASMGADSRELAAALGSAFCWGHWPQLHRNLILLARFRRLTDIAQVVTFCPVGIGKQMATRRSRRVRTAAYWVEQAAREHDPLKLLAVVADPLRGLGE